MATSEMFRGTGGPANTESTATASLTGVVDMWLKRKSHAETLKEEHQGSWTKYWRWYLNYIEPLNDPQDWWRSNAADPQAFKVIETIIPKSVVGMWGRQKNFSVNGRERTDAPGARKATALLDYFLDKTEFFPKFFECMKYTHTMGHSWGKVVWREEYEDIVRDEPVIDYDDDGNPVDIVSRRIVSQREVYNDPDFQWRMLDKVWADPTNNGRWFIESIDTTREELVEADNAYRKRTGQPLYKNLSIMGRGSSSMEAFQEQEGGMGIAHEITQPAESDGDRVRLLQCWGWTPKEHRGPDGNAWRLVVIANDIVEIRDVPIPTPDNRPPYFPIKAVPIPGRLYGESVLRWIGPQIDLKSKLANMRMDEAMLGVWQQYAYDRDAVSSNQMLFQPGGAIPVDTQGRSLRDVFSVIDRRPIMQEAYIEDQSRERTIEDTSAATPAQQGVADTSRQTATEVSTLTARGDQRFLLQNMYHDHTVKKEILTRALKWYQKQLPPERFVRIVGEDVDGEFPVDISEIDVPMDIDVKAGTEMFSREARLQSSSEFVQLTANDAAAPYIRIGEVVKQIAEDRGWPDPHRFIRTDEEVGQMNQQSQQAQMQAAQMQAALETQSKMAVEQAKQQATFEAAQQQFELDRAMAALDMEIKEKEAELRSVEHQMDLAGKSMELEMQREKLEQELEALRVKSTLEIQTLREKSAIAISAAREQAAAKPKQGER